MPCGDFLFVRSPTERWARYAAVVFACAAKTAAPDHDVVAALITRIGAPARYRLRADRRWPSPAPS
jgi:hypothetical protein